MFRVNYSFNETVLQSAKFAKKIKRRALARDVLLSSSAARDY